VAIRSVAEAYGLGFAPLADEHYDFFLPEARAGRAAVQAFLAALGSEEGRARLRALGFEPA
jgi:putative molybdopterin biosynthesis protein